MMTKRATHIKRFVDELADLAVNSFFVRMHAYTCKQGEEQQHLMAKEYIRRKKTNMMACMCEILENNTEQAEALLKDMGIHWIENEQEVKPEQEIKPDLDIGGDQKRPDLN